MKIYGNEALYRRNIRVGLIANLGGMFLLVAAVFVLFNQPGQLGRYLAFLLAGIILVQVGFSFSHWGKRSDLAFNKALKSLDGNYSIFHHRSPVQHLLVGPSGVWILLPKQSRGNIYYNKAKQRWENKGGNLFLRIWRWISQEKLGRPHFEAMIEAGALDRFLESRWESEDELHVSAAVVFMNEDVRVNTGDAPFPAVQLSKLKRVVVQGEEKGKLSKAMIKKLKAILQD